MKKITKVLNSPLKIGLFAVCTVAIICVVAFTSIHVGANVNANKSIGINKGIEVALHDAGFTAEEVADLTAQYDNDDGVASYDIDFSAENYEYDYTIKASDGSILEAKREKINNNSDKSENNGNTSNNNDPSDNTQTNNGASNNPNSNSHNNSSNTNSSSASNNQSSDNSNSKYIGADKAKSIALNDAGLSASSVNFTKAKLDREDGIYVYEVEFYTNGTEYEYEIHATSGKILSKDVDMDDDWDHDWDE